MANSYPQWTSELTDKFVPGEDQLGVEGAAQSYQQWLIPGIISTTDRARYYSFYAWVLYRFISLPGSSLLLKDFRGSFYKRHEMALILGSYSHHREREIIGGLVGSGTNNAKARSWWDASDPISLDTHYFQNKLGGFGQYYMTAMQVLEIVLPNQHPSWVYRLHTRGEALAKAYEESITTTRYAQNLKKAGQLTTLSHVDAQELGSVGCICHKALAASQDIPLLRDAFFRFEQRSFDNPHVRRRLALAVTLDLVRGGAGQFTRETIRPALYLGEYLPGLAYQSNPILADWAFRWRLVEVRHMYTFGLQCLWGAFLLRLKQIPEGISILEYEEWLTETLGEPFFNQSLDDYLNELCLEIGLVDGWRNRHEDFDQVCKQTTSRDEYTLFKKATQSKNDAHALLVNGIQILAQLFIRFRRRELENDPIWLEMAQRARLPLKIFFQFMDEQLMQSGSTIRSWLMRLYREYIWGQHEFMALEKLRYQGYDTFKFNYREGIFYWPFSTVDAYQEPVRLAGNRLNNALSILTDLGFVMADSQGYLSLSADGEEYLERCVEATQHEH